MITLRVTIFVKTSNFCFLVLCLALNFSNYFKVYLNSKYTIFFQNNCQNAPFGPFQQFTLGLSQVLVFSHRLQRYFTDNIVFQLVCSVFKTEISSFLQKNKNVFFTRIVFLSTLAKKFCKNRTFLYRILEFLDRFRRDLVKNMQFQLVCSILAVILRKKWINQRNINVSFRFLRFFAEIFTANTVCQLDSSVFSQILSLFC